jgi:hypothetical protein
MDVEIKWRRATEWFAALATPESKNISLFQKSKSVVCVRHPASI